MAVEFDSGMFKYSDSSELGSIVPFGRPNSRMLSFMVNFGNSKLTIRLKVDHIYVIFIRSLTSCIFNILKKKEKKYQLYFSFGTHRLHVWTNCMNS